MESTKLFDGLRIIHICPLILTQHFLNLLAIQPLAECFTFFNRINLCPDVCLTQSFVLNNSEHGMFCGRTLNTNLTIVRVLKIGLQHFLPRESHQWHQYQRTFSSVGCDIHRKSSHTRVLRKIDLASSIS